MKRRMMYHYIIFICYYYPLPFPSYLFSYVVQVVSSSMRSHPLDFFVFLASILAFIAETTGNGQSLNLLNGLAFVQKNQNGKILLLFCCILCVIVLVRRAKSVDDLIEKTLFLHLLSLLYILTHLYYNILLVRIFD